MSGMKDRSIHCVTHLSFGIESLFLCVNPDCRKPCGGFEETQLEARRVGQYKVLRNLRFATAMTMACHALHVLLTRDCVLSFCVFCNSSKKDCVLSSYVSHHSITIDHALFCDRGIFFFHNCCKAGPALHHMSLLYFLDLCSVALSGY